MEKNNDFDKKTLIWRIIGLILLIFGIYLMIVWVIPSFKEDLVKWNKSSEQSTQIKEEQPIAGLSPGIFYPSSDHTLINNSQPTIIGKLNQTSDELFLDANYNLEENPISGDKEYFLHFEPGKIKNLIFKIDDTIIDAYGFPQYPTVNCESAKENPTGGGFSTDKKIIFKNKRDCILGNLDKLPPVIFFLKPDNELSQGSHTFSIESDGNVLGKMIFVIDKNFRLINQNTPNYSSDKYYWDVLDTADNCYNGYYYSDNYVRVPLPIFDNKNLYYQLTFPHSEQEKTNLDKIIYLKINDKIFDLFFPQSSGFYGNNQEISNYPMSALYLPEENLYYINGEKANLWRYEKSELDGRYNYNREFLELLPVDISGKKYLEKYIPFETVGWSGCDG